MKKQIILSTIVLGALVGGTYAMYGQGNGQGHGQGRGMGQGHGMGQGFGKTLTAEQREKLQSMSMEERRVYVQKLRAEQGFTTQQGQGHGKGMGQGHGQGKEHGGNPADMIKNIPAGTVDESEKTFLINQYGEEKMARDLYNYAYEKYGIQTFSNIAKSEQKHMDAVKALLDRYNISAPSGYASDNELYKTLKSQIDKSKKDAIEVGITVEMVDIENIAKDIKSTDNKDIKTVLLRIGGASYNHLRGFVKALKNAGYTTKLEWTKYLSEDEINTKGPLTYKLAEKLEKEGIKLPQSSQEIKQSCAKKHGNEKGHGSYIGQGHKQARGMVQNQNVRRYVNQAKVQKYKKIIEDKYASKLDKLSQDKLNTINKKIDVLLEKIVNGNYSEKKKEIYTNVLLALKASILDRLDEESSDDILNSVLGE